MIEIIKEIHKLVNGFDKIPIDFNFKNNKYAIEITIGSQINDYQEREELPLQIRIVGLEKNKIDILTKSEEIDSVLDNKCINNFWIVRSNPYFNSYYDDDKFNAVLIYYIKNFE